MPQHVLPGIVYKTLDLYAEQNYQLYMWYSRYLTSNGTPQDTRDMSGTFRKFYTNVLKDLKKLEDTYSGIPGYENAIYMSRTWEAYVYYLMVASFGGVPMSQAITETEGDTYKYDTELEVYTKILSILREAVDGFNPQGDKLKLDPLFRAADKSSDIEKWRKFANTLQLDIALTVQNLNRDLAKEHVKAALAHEEWLISSLNDIVKIKCGTDENQDGSYYWRAFLKNHETATPNLGIYPKVNQYFFLYLRSYNDPRMTAYGQRAADKYRYMVSGDTISRKTPKTVSNPNPVTRDSIIVQYYVPYLPGREPMDCPLGWEVGTDPNSGDGTTKYRNPYDNTAQTESYMYISRDYLKVDATTVILNWADACFMKAEAAILFPDVFTGNPASYYEEGIKASFAEYNLSGVEDYLKQEGIKWDTDGNGLYEYRSFYKADIKGHSNPDGHLEQIYKQRYIADFFNGFAGWTLERRTRALSFPPYFHNTGASINGSNNRNDFMPERFLYAREEISYNRDAYYAAIANLQATSPNPRPDARWGDNFLTPLGFAKPFPYDLSQWDNGTVIYNAQFAQKWYGKTEEDFIINAAKEYPDINRNPQLGLIICIGYKVTKVLSTYLP
jgi:hypothetical protein